MGEWNHEKGLWYENSHFRRFKIGKFIENQYLPNESDYALGWDTPSKNGKRSAEKNNDFGEKFIELARKVYKFNDERAKIKLAIYNTLGSNVKEVKSAYNFTNLESFLNIFYQGSNVLINEQDFFDLTWAYVL